MENVNFVTLSVKSIQMVFAQDAAHTISHVKEFAWQIWQAASNKSPMEIVRFVNLVTRRKVETALQK